jgi:hypothetical protein
VWRPRVLLRRSRATRALSHPPRRPLLHFESVLFRLDNSATGCIVMALSRTAPPYLLSKVRLSRPSAPYPGISIFQPETSSCLCFGSEQGSPKPVTVVEENEHEKSNVIVCAGCGASDERTSLGSSCKQRQLSNQYRRLCSLRSWRSRGSSQPERKPPRSAFCDRQWQQFPP